ncbi:MAG: hypothetical protein ACTSRA_12060, partial [Promethearchaeota archaeon]
YQENISFQIKQKQTELNKLENEALNIQFQIASKKNKMKNHQKLINVLNNDLSEINSEILRITEKIERLTQEDKYTSPTKRENESTELKILLSNTLMQYISQLNDLRSRKYLNETQIINEYNQIENIKNELEELITQRKNIEEEKNILSEEINNLKSERNHISGIEKLHGPQESHQPIKPRKTLNILLGMMVGGLLSLLLAALLEFISKNKATITSQK